MLNRKITPPVRAKRGLQNEAGKNFFTFLLDIGGLFMSPYIIGTIICLEEFGFPQPRPALFLSSVPLP
jgi:hypothetical protein